MPSHTFDLDELKAERDRLDNLISAIEVYLSQSPISQPSVPAQPRERTSVRMIRLKRPMGMMEATQNAVGAILEEHGPQSISQLLQRLDRDALGLTGDHAGNVLSARLSNGEKFQGDRTRGWWFADRTYPENDDDF